MTAAKISVAELETLVKCSVVLDVLPLEVADDILSAFVDEAKRLRQGKGNPCFEPSILRAKLLAAGRWPRAAGRWPRARSRGVIYSSYC